MITVNGFVFSSAVDAEQLHKWLVSVSNVDRAMPHVPSRGVVVDGGAHVGLWSARFANHVQRVYAFEPMPENFACLRRNVPANVVSVNAALGDEERFVEFVREKYSVSHHIRRGESAAPLVTVRMTTIDSFALSNVGCIKLDVEGCELAALRGAAATIERERPLLHIEVKYIAPDALLQHMQEIDYRILYATSIDHVWIPAERRLRNDRSPAI